MGLEELGVGAFFHFKTRNPWLTHMRVPGGYRTLEGMSERYTYKLGPVMRDSSNPEVMKSDLVVKAHKNGSEVHLR